MGCAIARLRMLADGRSEPWSQQENSRSGDQTDGAKEREHGSPRQHDQQQRRCRRHRHFSNIAGEVIGADCLHRTGAAKRVRHQRRCKRMLGAGSKPGAEERHHEDTQAGAGAGEAIAYAAERGSKRKEKSSAGSLGQQPRRNLETGHGAGEQPAQEPELGIAEPELLLPDRQQDVDQIGIAVVQRVRAARHARNAALIAPRRGRHRLATKALPFGDGHLHLACAKPGGATDGSSGRSDDRQIILVKLYKAIVDADPEGGIRSASRSISRRRRRRKVAKSFGGRAGSGPFDVVASCSTKMLRDRSLPCGLPPLPLCL